MATRYHGRNQSLFVSTPANTTLNYNLTAELMECTMPSGTDLADISTAGSTGHRSYPGLQQSSGSFKFVMSTGANASFNVFGNAAVQQANPANYFIANYGPGGTAANSPQYTFNFRVKDAPISSPVTDVVTMTVAWEMDNGMTVGNF